MGGFCAQLSVVHLLARTNELRHLIPVFIGFDTREAVAFSVLSHSIQRRATQPVSITPLMLSQLSAIFTREKHPLQSTEFSFSRGTCSCLTTMTA